MPAMSKAQLIEKIQEYGETPPSTWGKTQLEGRLAELKHLHQVEEGSQTKSRVAELNKAARKKDHLLAYMKDNNIQHSGHETISQLLALGHRHILETTSPRGSDATRFGKHANLTYSEVANQDWNYVQWMLTTCQEAGGLKGTSDWRLKRFIQWYTHGQKGIQKPAGSSKKVEQQGCQVSRLCSKDLCDELASPRREDGLLIHGHLWLQFFQPRPRRRWRQSQRQSWKFNASRANFAISSVPRRSAPAVLHLRLLGRSHNEW